MDELEELYQSIILEHSKNPANFRILENYSQKVDGDNPFCGDEVTVYLQVERGRIVDLAFVGQGCAITRASASLMTLALKDRTLNDADTFVEKVLRILTDASEEHFEADSELIALEGVKKFPARIKCATLAWHALSKAIKNDLKLLNSNTL